MDFNYFSNVDSHKNKSFVRLMVREEQVDMLRNQGRGSFVSPIYIYCILEAGDRLRELHT